MVTTWSLSGLYCARCSFIKLIGRPETITSFNGSVSNLKVTRIDSDTFALVVTALATPSGSLYNPETAEKPKSTGKVYSKLFVVSSFSYSFDINFSCICELRSCFGSVITPISLRPGVRRSKAPRSFGLLLIYSANLLGRDNGMSG
jgi:hypothetical protein